MKWSSYSGVYLNAPGVASPLQKHYLASSNKNGGGDEVVLEKVVGSLHFQQAAQPSLLDVCFLALGVDSSIFFFLFISHLNLPLLAKFSPLLVYL